MQCHPATLPQPTQYRGLVTDVRLLTPRDIDDVTNAVASRLLADHELQPLVNPHFDDVEFSSALLSAASATWVARHDGRFAGHLFGAVLESSEHGRGAWIGPDGVSFDEPETLYDLYRTAGTSWISDGAFEHFVWVLDDASSTAPWHQLGFARMHQRGARELSAFAPRNLPAGYAIRRGGSGDIDVAVALDAELDLAQRDGPSFALGVDHASSREELFEALDDPDVIHYVVEHDGRAIAQCLAFELPPLRGSHPSTVHLSAVTVSSAERGLGIATAMVDHALLNAFEAGYARAETNWRITNHRAARFWVGYGFTPTFVRLHRTIGRF